MIINYLYAPVFWLGFVAAGSWLVAVRQAHPAVLLLVLVAAVGVSIAAEALIPYQREWNRDHGDRLRDIAHGVVNEVCNAAGIALLPLMAFLLPHARLWPDSLPFAIQLALAIVAADLGITMAHYFSHRFAWMWRLHAVHHSVKRMYGFNGLMKHPLHQSIEALAGLTPLVLLGIPVDVASVLAFTIAIQLLLQHSNIDIRLGPLRGVIAWAQVHRFHHLKYGKAGDVNFGLFLTVWDHLLGTAFDAPTYKMTSSDLGIGERPNYPKGYIAQLIEPFREQNTTPTTESLPQALAGVFRAGRN